MDFFLCSKEFTENNKIFRKRNVCTSSAEKVGETPTILGSEEQVFLIFGQPLQEIKTMTDPFSKTLCDVCGF